MMQKDGPTKDKSFGTDGNDDAWRGNVRGVNSAMRDMLKDAKSGKRTKVGLFERLRAAIGLKRDVPPSRS